MADKDNPIDFNVLSDDQIDIELEKGYSDMQNGRTKSAKTTFADIRKDYSRSLPPLAK